MQERAAEEQHEKKRHDNLYRKELDDDMFMAPQHYQKFDAITHHVHCYTYTVSQLGDVRGKRVLDLGCGAGRFSVILAKRGAAEVHGIEISPVAIEVAKKRAAVNGITEITRFSEMSFYDLTFPDHYFDLIAGLSVLHHADDKKLFRDNIFRVLKPGGRAVFNEPFGNFTALEKLRLLIPIDTNVDDKDHWMDQIKYRDLEIFKAHFDVSVKEFQLISRLDRVFKSSRLVQFMGHLDRRLLKSLPFLRPYARDIVIVMDRR